MVFLKYSIYPLSLCDKKGEYFFDFRPGMYFQTGQVFFLFQNGRRGSLLVFYVGFILDDKNTLCNGCKLTG
jgi:hypothetical protein